MTDAWQAYIDLAMGFTETSRKRATKVVKQMVGKGNITAGQLQTMAEELVNTGLANREAMVRLVRFELDRGLGRVGLATADEVSDLTGRVRELEEKLRAAEGALASQVPAEDEPVGEPVGAEAVPADLAAPVRSAPAKVAATSTIAKKTVAKKTVAKKVAPAPAPVKAAAPAKAAPVKAAATMPAAKSAPAKSAAKAVPAKSATSAATTASPTAAKTVAKKTVAKKTNGGTS